MTQVYKDIIRLTIDLKTGVKEVITPIKQADNLSRVLRCQLINNGKPINLKGSQLLLYVVKADYKQCVINGVINEGKTGIVDFELTEQSLILAQEIQCEIVKIDEGDVLLSFPIFKIGIDGALYDNGLVESTNEFSALTALISNVASWENRFAGECERIEEKFDEKISEVNTELSSKIQEVASTGTTAEVIQNKISEMAQDGTITFNTITPNMTTFLKQTKNLFNKLSVKKGCFWSVASGEQVNTEFSYAKILCEKGKKYVATGTSYNTIFFDSLGNKLGADNNSNGMPNCVISTESYTGSAYFILNFRHSQYPPDTYMVVEGSSIPSKYVQYGYTFTDDIIFNKNNSVVNNSVTTLNVKKDGTGDFTKVYDAVKYAETYASKNSVVDIYIHDTSTNHKGTSFDILDEMGGQDYLSTISNTSNNQLGLPLKGYINLFGIGKVKLYAHLPDNCTLAQSTCFSTLDIFGETTLENLTIEIKNGRYAVHDESNNKHPNKKHVFKKCKLIHLGNKSGLWSAPHAYASGTSAGCIYEYEDCIFDASASGGYPWDMHNYAPQQGSVISLNGCEMKKSSSQAVSIKLGFNGYSPVTSDPTAYETCFNDVFIKNVIADGVIQAAPEVNSYTCTNNFRLHNFTNITEDIKEDFIKS